MNALFDGEPVKVMEDRSDVISVAGMGEQTSSRVLDVLEFSFFLVINCFFIFLLCTEVVLR